jgi:hypothetical protein
VLRIRRATISASGMGVGERERDRQTDRGCIEKKQGEVKFLILEGSISISTIPGVIEVSTFSKGVNEPLP